MAVTVEFAINTNGNDTSGRRSIGTWDEIDNLGLGDYVDNPDSTPSLLGLSKADSTSFLSSVVYLSFNTGAIPANATIIAASLKLYVVEKSTPFTGAEQYAADFYDYGGSPSTSADWESVSSGNAIATIDGTTLTESAVNTIPLTGLSGITRSGETNAQGATGITGIRLSAKTATEPTTDEWIDFAAYEHASQEPRLEVTYIPPPTRTGTASQVDASGAESSSTSVTVPSDATMAVAFWSMWDGAGGGLDSLSLGANAFTFEAAADIDVGAETIAAGVASLDSLPGTGSQTISWVWTPGVGSPDEGGWITVVWVKDHNTTTPVRDSGLTADRFTDDVEVTIDTEVTDLVLAACQKFETGSPPVLDGTVFIDDALLNSEYYELSQVTPGSPTTTVTMTQESFSTIMAISLPMVDEAGAVPLMWHTAIV